MQQSFKQKLFSALPINFEYNNFYITEQYVNKQQQMLVIANDLALISKKMQCKRIYFS